MKLLLLFLFSGSIGVAAVDAQEFQFQPEKGQVEFKTKGWPNLVTIKGEGQGVTGQLQQQDSKVSGTLTFQLASLKTGIELRDSHMKDTYLEVEKYPTTTLTLNDVVVPEDLDGSFEFSGLLNLHGVEKEVRGEAELNADGQVVKMTAEVPIKLSDFGIAIPSYKGITVAEKVTIHFSSQVNIL
jgi:polyisoprenoid-binding protein YceI